MTTTTGTLPTWVKGYDVILDERDDIDSQKKETEFDKLLHSEESKTFAEGEVFKGTIVSLTDDFVMVDIGYKQEGLVLAREFRGVDGEMKIKVGDQIDVYLEKLESSMGNLVLSKDKAEIIVAWDRISEACEKGTPVEGSVLSKVKGGLSVDIGVKAFLPGSQIDIRPTRNLDKYLGKKMQFKVIKFNKKRGNIVLSRRAILQEERGKLRDETLKQIEDGMVVKGIVKNITDYGAFIDLGGVDGLLHITDMSWGRVKHPTAILNVGDEVEVKILKFDRETERVSLGLKQVQPNPWETINIKYPVGSVASGTVVSIKDYGIFIELDDGIEGLVHVSEMSWHQKPKHPSKYVELNQRIEARVLEVDVENKRISLGIKQLQSNPWDTIMSKYHAGQKVKGKIKSIVEFGMFIDMGEEVDALVHISDVSWVKKNISLHADFKDGQEIEAIVLSVDPDNQKFCLGIKQLEEDPWKRIEERFPVGTIIEADVMRVTDFGAFVELETGIEGLVHISEISDERVENPSDVIKKADKVKVMVISVDKESKKIALSMKAVGKEEASQSVKSQGRDEYKPATLADKLKGITINSDEE